MSDVPLRPLVDSSGSGSRASSSRAPGSDRIRDPGLPLADRDLGTIRSAAVRVDRRIPRRSVAGLGLLRAPAGRAPRGEPNDGHRALAELEDGRLGEAVITQNVDRLHERAGTRKLVEVHGSLRRELPRLRHGRAVEERAAARRRRPPRARAAGGSSSRTSSCSASSSTGTRSSGHRRSRPGRSLLLVVGSSLEVYPVAGLPLETLAAGGSLAIVNRGETPYDSRASRADRRRRRRDAAPRSRQGYGAPAVTPRRSPRASGRPAATSRARRPGRRDRRRTRSRSSRPPCGRARRGRARSHCIGCASSRWAPSTSAAVRRRT